MTEKLDAKSTAAKIVSQSWEEAMSIGVPPDLFASTALSAALTSLVSMHGSEAAARMVDQFAEAVRSGKFDQKRGLHS